MSGGAKRIIMAMMDNPDVFSAEEREIAYKAVVEWSIKTCRARGRPALLRLAHDTLGPEPERELDGIADLDVMCAQLNGLLMVVDRESDKVRICSSCFDAST